MQCVSERVEDQRIFGRIGPDSRELVSRERDSRSWWSIQKYKVQLGQIRFANIKHKYFCSTVFRMAFLFHWICICMESINVFPRFGLRSPPAVGHFGDGWVGEEGFVIQIGANIASVINIIAKSQHPHQNHLHHRVASAIFNNSINSSIQILLFLGGLSK